MQDLEIRILDSSKSGFGAELEALLTRKGESNAGVDEVAATEQLQDALLECVG